VEFLVAVVERPLAGWGERAGCPRWRAVPCGGGGPSHAARPRCSRLRPPPPPPFQHRPGARSAAGRSTTHEPGPPGARLRIYLDRRQEPGTRTRRRTARRKGRPRRGAVGLMTVLRRVHRPPPRALRRVVLAVLVAIYRLHSGKPLGNVPRHVSRWNVKHRLASGAYYLKSQRPARTWLSWRAATATSSLT
jgi:hypothetical protein